MMSDDFETLPCRQISQCHKKFVVWRYAASHNGVLLQNVRINHLQQVIKRFLLIQNIVWNSAWSSIVSSRMMVALKPSVGRLLIHCRIQHVRLLRRRCFSATKHDKASIFSTFCFLNIIWSWSTAVRSGAEKRRPSGRAVWMARPDGMTHFSSVTGSWTPALPVVMRRVHWWVY